MKSLKTKEVGTYSRILRLCGTLPPLTYTPVTPCPVGAHELPLPLLLTYLRSTCIDCEVHALIGWLSAMHLPTLNFIFLRQPAASQTSKPWIHVASSRTRRPQIERVMDNRSQKADETY